MKKFRTLVCGQRSLVSISVPFANWALSYADCFRFQNDTERLSVPDFGITNEVAMLRMRYGFGTAQNPFFIKRLFDVSRANYRRTCTSVLQSAELNSASHVTRIFDTRQSKVDHSHINAPQAALGTSGIS